MIASVPQAEQDAFLDSLTINELRALPFYFDFWALPHQVAPEGDWRTWVILGGRGAGKTRAGAEWVRSQVEGNLPTEPGLCRRVALVGETIDDVISVMIHGDSGIIACTPPDRRPTWEAGRKRLVWPNGAVAEVYSAHNADGLRGPQFDAAWVDELAKWPRAEDAWDMLQFALRIGDIPRQVVTTTPKDVAVLKRILETPSTVLTHAGTEANKANLAASFLAEVEARYGGTALGRQELEGILIDERDGAMWPKAALAEARVDLPGHLDRVVVAVDPPVTGSESSDECGIIVVGARQDGHPRGWTAVVLEDASVKAASPTVWARAAIDAMQRHGAERLVAEVNQGGDLVESVLRQIDGAIPYRAVRATKGKVARAEPVAALYEQGRVRHLRGLSALEDQMRAMTYRGFDGRGSPDRVDALVWALHDLILDPSANWRDPRVRSLV